MSEKLTKQDVRDLNHLPSKPAGRRVLPHECPGMHSVCRNIEQNTYGERCVECGRYVRIWRYALDE